MNKKLIFALVGALIALLLLPLVSPANTTTTNSDQIGIVVVEKPYEITVVITPQGNMTAMMENCEAYTDVVKEKVFGSDNPAVNGTESSCIVGNDGRVYYIYDINKDFYIEKNGTLVISPIPLAGKFLIKIIPYDRIDIENGTKKFFVYAGEHTEFIGTHTPMVTYNVVEIYDPKKTFYVIPTDSSYTILVFNKDFDFSKVKIGGKTVNQTINGYVYVRGSITKIKMLDKLRAYFIYDKKCYSVGKDKEGNIYVRRIKGDCDGVPASAITYYDGKGTIFITYEPPSKLKLELAIIGILIALAVGLAVYIKKNVEFGKE